MLSMIRADPAPTRRSGVIENVVRAHVPSADRTEPQAYALACAEHLLGRAYTQGDGSRTDVESGGDRLPRHPDGQKAEDVDLA